MLKIKFLVIAIAISFAGILSSCYYDYGIDSEDSNVVVTLYDNTYPFNSVERYILDTAVKNVGSVNLNGQYNSTINSSIRTNLNKLGWTEITNPAPGDSTAAGVVIVGSGTTTTTYTVDYNDYYWYGGGYYWGYPSYGYDYSYSYTTGTVIVAISDLKNKSGDQLPVEWSCFLNGATGQSNPVALIQSGMNQAFSQSQSPYLYE